MRELGAHDVEAAVAGGLRARRGRRRLGRPRLPRRPHRRRLRHAAPRGQLDELDDDALVATVTAIGAPAAEGWEMRPADYVRALSLLRDALDAPVVGTITAQNGSSTTCNGWVQSAVLGTVVVDAAGDGRAHPTGKMGSMGLTARPEHRTVQAAAGGNRAAGRYLEVIAHGTVAHTAAVLRRAADESGGFIAAARNPLPVSYLREHAAVGAISFALRLGEAMLAAEPDGGEAVIATILDTLGGRELARGTVRRKALRYDGAFDIGSLSVDEVELGLVNEYLTAEAGGERLATFPDVLTTLSCATGRPVSIADVRDGDEVVVLHVEKSRVPLGAGVRDPSVYPEVEAMLGKPLAEHALS